MSNLTVGRVWFRSNEVFFKISILIFPLTLYSPQIIRVQILPTSFNLRVSSNLQNVPSYLPFANKIIQHKTHQLYPQFKYPELH